MLKGWKSIVTLGPLGYYKAPGTMGSLAAIPLVVFIYSLKIKAFSMMLILFFLTLATFKVVAMVMPYFNYQDSSHIVIDEVLGMVYTFWDIDLNLKALIGGFIFFRFFDITKILGISYLEKNIPNPASIVVDDIVAGLLANFLLRFLVIYEIL